MPAFRVNTKPAQAWPHPASDEEQRWRRTVADGSACCHTRRAAVRLLSLSALAVPAALRIRTAHAIKGWCRRDPIVKIGDLTVDIVLFSYPEMDKLATGASQLVITVPAGIPTRFVADDPGFGHLGYDVRFVESHELIADDRSVDVQVEAHIPATNPPDGPLPLLVRFTALGDGRPAPDQAEGRANEWLLLRSNLAVRDFAPPSTSPDELDDTTQTTRRDQKEKDKDKDKDKKGRGKK